MEKEADNRLAFLDVLVFRRADGSLGHKVYGKAIHTNCYFYKLSNHHPSQKQAVLKTLMDRAKRICELWYLDEELRHLERPLQANGYSVKRGETSGPTEKNNQTEGVGVIGVLASWCCCMFMG